jgi:hypothetical protein
MFGETDGELIFIAWRGLPETECLPIEIALQVGYDMASVGREERQLQKPVAIRSLGSG